MDERPDLDSKIQEIATAPVLLVASDFDGTVAPIVARFEDATAAREALVALRMLAELPHTHVAIVSGRALADLGQRVEGARRMHLVGSHGSEFETGFVEPLTEALERKLAALSVELEGIASRFDGARIEHKPGSLAFHYRQVAAREAEAAADAVRRGPGLRDGVQVRSGKKVVELSVVPANKGMALDRIRKRLGASTVLYFGDDVTDEDAFETLVGPDIGVKVGEGPSRAPYRLRDHVDVAHILVRIAETRATWLAGKEAVPIESHSMLSDQRTAALVTPGGRVAWFCAPRIDSAALFAELIGGAPAGFFEVRAAGSSRVVRQFNDGDSFVLVSEWPSFQVVDYLDAANGRAFQRAGRSDLLRVIEGYGRALVTFAPRLDFGRSPTRLVAADGGIVVEGARDSIVLHAPGVAFEIVDDGAHQTARAAIDLEGRPVVLELRCGTASLESASRGEPERRVANVRFWSGFAASLTLPPRFAEAVKRSALVLKALTYGPNGAIVAAATTSLPESRGGVRNWDYRFCWPRDAAIAAHALARVGSMWSGLKLLDWLFATLERGSSEAPEATLPAPVYTVGGSQLSPEADLAHLAGYAGSRPVRINNAAAQQIQLDVLGPIVALIAELARSGAPLSAEHLRLVETMVDAVRARWREPDHGIWEIRLPRRHHVHSRVACWQALDSAARVSRYLGKPRPEWFTLADEIKADILEHGFDASQNAFGTSYDDHAPDAAALWVGLSGMLAPDDSRFVGTVAYVERHLKQGSSIYRYRFDDGLPGREGAFNVSTTWFIESLALIGRRAEAEAMFDDYLKLAGPTGLIAEEVEPESGMALGNVPQAYSHAGLIHAAVRLAPT